MTHLQTAARGSGKEVKGLRGERGRNREKECAREY